MTKNQKLLAGVGLVAVAALLYNKYGKKKPFASFVPKKIVVRDNCIGWTGQMVSYGGETGLYDCCQMGYAARNKPANKCNE